MSCSFFSRNCSNLEYYRNDNNSIFVFSTTVELSDETRISRVITNHQRYVNIFLIYYALILNLLLTNLLLDYWFHNSDIQKWCKHKKIDVVIANYNIECTYMNKTIFARIKKHINAVETTHHKSNALERRLTLLKTIKK